MVEIKRGTWVNPQHVASIEISQNHQLEEDGKTRIFYSLVVKMVNGDRHEMGTSEFEDSIRSQADDLATSLR